MTTWYDPQETKDQANGAQTQPEFDPPPTPGIDLVQGGLPPEVAALIERQNEVAAIVDGLSQ